MASRKDHFSDVLSLIMTLEAPEHVRRGVSGYGSEIVLCSSLPNKQYKTKDRWSNPTIYDPFHFHFILNLFSIHSYLYSTVIV